MNRVAVQSQTGYQVIEEYLAAEEAYSALTSHIREAQSQVSTIACRVGWVAGCVIGSAGVIVFSLMAASTCPFHHPGLFITYTMSAIIFAPSAAVGIGFALYALNERMRKKEWSDRASEKVKRLGFDRLRELLSDSDIKTALKLLTEQERGALDAYSNNELSLPISDKPNTTRQQVIDQYHSWIEKHARVIEVTHYVYTPSPFAYGLRPF